jgi:hypothetical protein
VDLIEHCAQVEGQYSPALFSAMGAILGKSPPSLIHGGLSATTVACPYIPNLPFLTTASILETRGKGLRSKLMAMAFMIKERTFAAMKSCSRVGGRYFAFQLRRPDHDI